jgi:hypothetical protein
VGAALSCVCACHCLAVPLLAAVLPFAAAAVVLSERLEVVLLAASALTGATSIVAGYVRTRGGVGPLVLLAVGLVLLVAPRVGGEPPIDERWLTTLGAGLVAAAHLRHRALGRRAAGAEHRSPP